MNKPTETPELEYLLKQVKYIYDKKQVINMEILEAMIEAAISNANIDREISEMKP